MIQVPESLAHVIRSIGWVGVERNVTFSQLEVLPADELPSSIQLGPRGAEQDLDLTETAVEEDEEKEVAESLTNISYGVMSAGKALVQVQFFNHAA
ncbi:hypothetical protein M378DRAFT_19212 [Amanita muscaria Koide BX008]|uniref:Uncharacterized protein n=1 Tax=Amanita muscaria (strain Koide BX008) TaxID=946122 RepID=A0A0C2SJK2_AMAMK|nr:hypothetical protein M378DRAFT_19212 [Amanita muscaria Koide BX008]